MRAATSTIDGDAMDPAIPLSRATRTSVMLRADVFRLHRSQADSHRVTNISETGLCIVQGDTIARARSDAYPGAGAGAPTAMLEVGSVVVVAIGRIEPVAADVVWARAGLAGLRFQTPIDVALARARRGAGEIVTPPAAGWLAALNDPYAKT